MKRGAFFGGGDPGAKVLTIVRGKLDWSTELGQCQNNNYLGTMQNSFVTHDRGKSEMYGF